jgi:hypothetical protein
MAQECPEIGWGGGSRGDGVKAPEDSLGPDAHPWGLLRGLSEADGELVGMRETPESRCDFILQVADGELLMLHDCPEFLRRGKDAPRSPATSGTPPLHPSRRRRGKTVARG